MENDKFMSFDKTTGMLQDKEEIRELGLMLARYLGNMLRNPMVRLLMPPGQMVDAIALTTSAITAFSQTSQADQTRMIGQLSGVPSQEVENAIKAFGLSEVLPSIHPDAPNPDLPPLDPNDPINLDSIVLRHGLEKEAERGRVVLPDSIETFIQDLLKGE